MSRKALPVIRGTPARGQESFPDRIGMYWIYLLATGKGFSAAVRICVVLETLPSGQKRTVVQNIYCLFKSLYSDSRIE